MAKAPRRTYSEADVATALTALRGNNGQIRATSRELDIPPMTLSQWASETRREETPSNRAERVLVSTQQSEATIQTLNTVIPKALERVLEALPTMSGYHAMLTAAIGIDKRQLLSGGATSRTEVLRARYVEPGALRSVSSAVIDVPAKRVEPER